MPLDDDCKIHEDKEFHDCQNVLLILSDMDFHSFTSDYYYWKESTTGINETLIVRCTEMSVSRDVKRIFGQSKVGENSKMRYSV